MSNRTMSQQDTITTETIGFAETRAAVSGAAQPHSATRPGAAGTGAANIASRPGAEYYDGLLWRIESRRPHDDATGFLLGFTSSDRRAGVTTVAANLAIRAADHGLGPVLLADCNFCHPTLHTLFRAKRTVGVADILANQATLDACVQSTPIAGLQLLPSGTTLRLQNLRVAPERIQELATALRDRFALVVADLPAASELGATLLLATALDAALLVVRSERCRAHSALQAVQHLSEDRVPLAGTVLTERHRDLPNWLERLV
jgi:Mrp family chromosome partitioning ATPase